MLGWNKNFKIVVTSSSTDTGEEMEKRSEHIKTTENISKFIQEINQVIKAEQELIRDRINYVVQSNKKVEINVSKGFNRLIKR